MITAVFPNYCLALPGLHTTYKYTRMGRLSLVAGAGNAVTLAVDELPQLFR